MKRPLVVNVDVDGVLYDFTDAMRSAFDYRGFEGAADWPDPQQWAVWETWPITLVEWQEVLTAEIHDGYCFKIGNPIDGAIEGANRLHDAAGVSVRLVTSKTFPLNKTTYMARRSTMTWLRAMGIPYVELFFTSPLIGKAGLRADVVIDDNPQVGEWGQANALNIVFDQPWNKSLNFEGFVSHEQTRVKRARSWSDVVEMVYAEREMRRGR